MAGTIRAVSCLVQVSVRADAGAVLLGRLLRPIQAAKSVSSLVILVIFKSSPVLVLVSQ